MVRWSALVPVLLVLCRSSSSQPVRVAEAPRRVVARVIPDRLPEFERTQVKSEKPNPIDRNREIEPAAPSKHPPEWWAVQNAIAAEEDASSRSS